MMRRSCATAPPTNKCHELNCNSLNDSRPRIEDRFYSYGQLGLLFVFEPMPSDEILDLLMVGLAWELGTAV